MLRFCTLSAGILATILDIGTGVFILLAISQGQRQQILSISTCASYAIIAVANVATLFLKHIRSNLYIRLTMILASVVPLVLAACTFAFAVLTQSKGAIGQRFCPVDTACSFAGDPAVLVAILLWFGTGITQSVYTALYINVKSTRSPTRRTDTPIFTPVRHQDVQQQMSFRYPVQPVNENEPFSFEAALRSRTDPPPGHTKEASTLQSTFIKSHVTNASHSRSWASTMPTAISGASPRSHILPWKNTSEVDDTSRRGSPEKQTWVEWGLGHGSPRHKPKTENLSSSNTHSSTSSSRSRPFKKPNNLKFHLPKSPSLSELDILAFPVPHSRQHSPKTPALTLTDDETAEPIYATTTSVQEASPRRRKRASPIRSSFDLPFTHRTSNPPSPDRQKKRSSILDAIKPRLPDTRTFSRTSWTPTSSPRKQHQAPRRELDDTAFSEWDTSHVSNTIILDDSRNVSGSSQFSDESVWQGRDVRVASDGSIIERER